MKTTAILTSGGLDSYVAWRLAPDPKVAVWVNFGQPYAEKEHEALCKLGVPFIEVDISNMFPIPITVENWVIPGRNLLLAFAGAQYGDVVWLSALDGEMHEYPGRRDKSQKFFDMTTTLFTYIFDCLRPDTLVATPFSTLTKSDVVALALKSGITVDELLATSTCYDEVSRNCGMCGTCFKRWIAMTLNGVAENYASPPWLAPYALSSRAEMRTALINKDFSHFSYKRIDETRGALARIGETL